MEEEVKKEIMFEGKIRKIWDKEKKLGKGKDYKIRNIVNISSLRIVMILPGNREIARRFSFFNVGGFYG